MAASLEKTSTRAPDVPSRHTPEVPLRQRRTTCSVHQCYHLHSTSIESWGLRNTRSAMQRTCSVLSSPLLGWTTGQGARFWRYAAQPMCMQMETYTFLDYRSTSI